MTDQVQLKAKLNATSVAVSAALRLAKGTQGQRPQAAPPAEEPSAENDPLPMIPRSTLRMDPVKRASMRAEAAQKQSAVVAHEIEVARQKFSEMDKDGNGVLDKNELSKLCEWSFDSFLKNEGNLVVSPEQRRAQTDKLMAAADKNGDGKIDFDEFAAWFTPTCESIQAFQARERNKASQKKAQKKAAQDVARLGQRQREVSESESSPGVRKLSRNSPGLAACCGTPQADRPQRARTPAAEQETLVANGDDVEPPVDMEYKRQHIDRPIDADQGFATNHDDAQNISAAARPAGGSPKPGADTTQSLPADPSLRVAPRTRSSTPPRMTRAGLAARMEQARALSPRRTASGGRSTTPPRSGTPPRRKVITSDELGTKIQAVRA